MSIFAVEILEDVTGIIPIYKLVRNGKCQFDEFMDTLERSGNMRSEFGGVFSIIDRIANFKVNECNLPDTLFKQLKGCGKVKDYEIRKNSVRVYLCNYLDGYLLILGGYKPNQSRDITYMRKLKDDFLNH